MPISCTQLKTNIKHCMNSIISETKFQLPPSNLHNLNINPFPVALSYFPLAPSFVCKSIDFNSLWYGDFWQKIKLHIFSVFLFVSLRMPSLFTPSCWYRNACSVKLKPMHFWLRNKFAPLMRLELVQGSAMKTLFTLIFLHDGIIQRLLLFRHTWLFPLGMQLPRWRELSVFLWHFINFSVLVHSQSLRGSLCFFKFEPIFPW